MTDVLLFHHAQGLTTGVQAFADRLRAEGHTVTVPDLYAGATFDTLDGGIDFARDTGFDTIVERGRLAAEGLPADLVYAGFSLGVMPAQLLAQTRPGARGALFFDACLPPAEFGSPWPDGLPLQVHGMDADPLFAEEGDLEAARALVAEVTTAELFLYPGRQHLFADSSLSGHDPVSAGLLEERVSAFLAALG